MKKVLGRLFDKTFLIYVLLGIVNYFCCSAIMLFFRHVLHVSENACLYISFFLQTFNSFVLNRYVTFRGIPISRYWQLKFVISVGTCVIVARVLLKKLLQKMILLPFFSAIADWLYRLLQRTVGLQLNSEQFRSDLILLACTFTYCVMNYVGQRYFVFKPLKQDTECPPPQADRTADGSVQAQTSDPEST